MHEWFQQIVDFVATASIGRGIVFAILAGGMLTQWIKFQFPDWLTDKQHTRWTRTAASILTMFVYVILSPDGMKPMATEVIGLVAGLASPTIYWLAVKCLYHFFPWMDNVLSARPEAKE